MISDAAYLEVYQPPVFERKPETERVRSLEFIRTVRDELGSWRRQFGDYRSARKQHLDHQVDQSYRNGYERGFEDGITRERNDRIAAIDSLLQEAKRKKEHAVRNIESRVVELAVRIAERVIIRSLEIEPASVANIVREVMSEIVGGETVVLRVSDEDFALVNSRYDEWLGMSGNAREFRIEADKRLHRGDCIVETEGGIIDGVIASRLDFLVEEMLKR